MIVIEKPRQFTMVKAVPLDSGMVFCATSVEKSGESATTIKPQNTRKRINSTDEFPEMIKGEIRQHKPEQKRANPAVLFVPKLSDK